MNGHRKLEKHRAKGGNVEDELDRKEEGEGEVKAYDAQGSEVEKEARERKKGGKCMPERKRGGRMMEEHRIEGKKARMHLGRPGRKSGGRVGSDKSPLTSANDTSPVVDHSVDD